MEKSETRDFMNVDSFSQLPFIRPAATPPKDKPVRLFGIEFQNSGEGASVDQTNNTTTTEIDVQTKDVSTTTTTSDTTANSSGGGTGRKFECHYCCRNFPTSQALGGHQNAHKRERQHAKRAYLQSAAMLHQPTDHHHLYGGVLGYHRMGPTTSSSSWTNSFTNTTTTSTNYHTSLSRYYPSSSNYHSYPSHHHHHHQPPINGSPLAMWRIPSVQPHSGSTNRDRSLLQHQYPPPPPPPLPLIDTSKPSTQTGQYVVLDPKKGFQDHVSLDLHL